MLKANGALAILLGLLVTGCFGGPEQVPPPDDPPPTPTGMIIPLSAPEPDKKAEEPPARRACPSGAEGAAGGCRSLLGDPIEHDLEASLALDPRNPDRAVVAWTVREYPRVAGVSATPLARVHAAVTADRGATWRPTLLVDPSVVDLPGAPRFAFDQRALFGPDGVAHVAYIGGSPRVSVVEDAGRITVASTSDGANWSYATVVEIPGVSFDYLGFAVAPDTGHLYLATDETTTMGVWVFRSEDGGVTWLGPEVVRASRAPSGYHALPSLVALPGGRVLLATNAQGMPEDPLAHGLAVSVSTDDGATFGEPALVTRAPYDDLANMPAVGLTFGESSRVVALVASEDGLHAIESLDDGVAWSAPVRLHGSLPTWATLVLGPDGSWATLSRVDGDETEHVLVHAPAGRSATVTTIARGSIPFDGEKGDDYGGVAIGADGSTWAAYSLGDGEVEQIAVHVWPPL